MTKPVEIKQEKFILVAYFTLIEPKSYGLLWF